MNVYCVICKKEMEVMEDLGTELSVFPCKCQDDKDETDNISTTNRAPQIPPRGDSAQAMQPLRRD